MRTSVIVPTHRRVNDLLRCLDALAAQEEAADEVILIVRCDDAVTASRLTQWRAEHSLHGLQVQTITEPGVVAAYNLGLACATGDIVCFTDDDAAPHPDWIARMRRGFAADSRIGGIGGRDVIYERGQPLLGKRRRVGLISWYGRVAGNHHLGTGGVRRVTVLKGVNMGWRRVALDGLRFDSRLRGSGAQVHCELAFSLALVRRGWWLIYDPDIVVDHFHAPRLDEDQRSRFNELAFFNASFNLRLILYETLPPLRRPAYLLYVLLIGSRDDPGMVRAIMLACQGDGFARALHKWRLTCRALRAARRAARHGSSNPPLNAPHHP